MESIRRMARFIHTTPQPLVVFGAATLGVMLPLYLPGYIFALDMAFTPTLPMPTSPTASYPFHALLHYLSLLVPGDMLQKLLLSGILFGSGYGLYRLVRALQAHAVDLPYANLGAYIGGVLYMVNPYTYSRLMTGQYAVLLGYACLPFFAHACLRFYQAPSTRTALTLAGWTILIAIVSIHTLGLAAIIAAAGLGAALWQRRTDRPYRMSLLRYGALFVGVTILFNCYWLIPLLMGTNSTATAIAGFTTADQQAFVTRGGSFFGRLLQVSVLQGFWVEGRNMYLLPQAVIPLWGLITLGLWIVVGWGLYALWRRHRQVAWILLACVSLAALLACTNLASWLGSHLLFLQGYREPHKFVGVVALGYSICVAFGTQRILARYQAKAQQLRLALATVAVLLLPIVLTPTMWWGSVGQLTPRQYPADWATMRTYLDSVRKPGDSVLFLPWHLYMHVSFADRIIVNPAEGYFGPGTIASNELEFRGASPTFPDKQKTRMSQLLQNAKNADTLGAQLRHEGIQYVLLTKEYDYRRYEYLNHQADLHLIKETPHFKLYLNTAKGEYAP